MPSRRNRAEDDRLTKWLHENIPKKDRDRFGMAYTPKPASQFIARITLEQARENGLIRELSSGQEWLPALEPFADIGIMVEDTAEVWRNEGILPCIIAYELNPLAAKECQRRCPYAYVVNTDTFETPVETMLEWEQAFMTHFRLTHEYPNATIERPQFTGVFQC